MRLRTMYTLNCHTFSTLKGDLYRSSSILSLRANSNSDKIVDKPGDVNRLHSSISFEMKFFQFKNELNCFQVLNLAAYLPNSISEQFE